MKNTCLLSSIVLLLTSTHCVAAETANQTTLNPNANPNISINTPDTNLNNQDTSTTLVPTTTEPAINCFYKISPQITTIDLNILKQWAEYAATQSFQLSYSNLDQNINQLKPCFTEQGFIGFQNALQKSGNLSAIKNQKFNVSAVKNGDPSVEVIPDGRWKIIVPLSVVYQNEQEKIPQDLFVTLLIERKANGEFGIMQMNAKAKNSEANSAMTTDGTSPTTKSIQSAAPTTPTSTAIPEQTNTTPSTNPTGVPPSSTTVQPADKDATPSGTAVPVVNSTNVPGTTSNPNTANPEP